MPDYKVSLFQGSSVVQCSQLLTSNGVLYLPLDMQLPMLPTQLLEQDGSVSNTVHIIIMVKQLVQLHQIAVCADWRSHVKCSQGQL